MDIRKYEVFLKVVERGNINTVSYDLGYTHSGVSKMINSMENELGFQIVKRTNKGITLTKEGEQLIPIIRNIVRENDKFEEEVALINGLESGSARIGCFPTTGIVLLPKLIEEFNELHPNVNIQIMEEDSLTEIDKWLNNGIIDIAVYSKQEHHKFDWIWEWDDDYVALLPRNHRLAKCDVVSISELFEEKVIPFRSYMGLDQDIVKIFKNKDADVREISGVSSNADLIVSKLVSSGKYVALIPKLIAGFAARTFDLTYRPIDVQFSRTIGFAVKDKKNLSPTVKKLVEFIKAHDFQKDMYE